MKKLALLFSVFFLVAFPAAALAQEQANDCVIQALTATGDVHQIAPGEYLRIDIPQGEALTVGLQIVDEQGMSYGDLGGICATTAGLACGAGGDPADSTCETEAGLLSATYKVGANPWQWWYVKAAVMGQGDHLTIHVLTQQEINDLLWKNPGEE